MTAPPFPARLSLFVWLCLCVASAHAQQTPAGQPAPTDEIIRVSTELIQTDVVVFDKQGNFVDNLRPEDFDLRVDGHAQSVAFFERVRAGSVNEEAQLAAARGGRDRTSASSGAAVRPLDRGRVVFFFIDDLHLSTVSLNRTRGLLLHFIDEQLGQNDQVALVTASGQLGFLQQPTDEKDVLHAAVARLSYREYSVRDSDRPAMSVMDALSITHNDPSVISAFTDVTVRENFPLGNANNATFRNMAEAQVRTRASQLIQQVGLAATQTLSSLLNLLRSSAQLPGRKLVYFISDGFVLDSKQNDTLAQIRRVTDAAVRGGVVVYTLDARGLAAALAGLPDASSGPPVDPTGRLALNSGNLGTATQEPLRVIADETGGRALLNTDSLTNAIKKALQETSVYYLLAWRPEQEETRGGKFRRLEVSVRQRPELTVLVQRGFFNTPPMDAPPRKRDAEKRDSKHTDPNGASPTADAPADTLHPTLVAALRAIAPRTALPTALTLNYLNAPPAGLIVASSVQINVEPAAQPKHLDLLGVVYDERGQSVASYVRHIVVNAKAAAAPAPPPAAGPQHVNVTYQIHVAPGLYQVRVATREVESGRTGSASQWLTVPALAGGKLALSSIFLGERPHAAEPNAPDAPPEQTPGLIDPARRFLRNSVLRFVLYIYNPVRATPTTAPDVAMQVQIFRDDQPVVTTPLRKITTEGLTDFATLAYAADLNLQNLPTGRYILQATAIDRTAKASATQRVKFTIE